MLWVMPSCLNTRFPLPVPFPQEAQPEQESFRPDTLLAYGVACEDEGGFRGWEKFDQPPPIHLKELAGLLQRLETSM
jgi:hypothetical protein